jgi:GNAT superfamily N-acetyltransferase
MQVEQVITYLELTSLEELVPGEPAEGVTFEEVAWDNDFLRALHDRVGAVCRWSSVEWSPTIWREHVSKPTMRHWIIRIEEQPAGLLSVVARDHGETEIDMFGLVPEFIGKGHGGHVLTCAAKLAWETRSSDGASVQKIVLHTSSFDHPNALPNYKRRGFRVIATETKMREIRERDGRLPETQQIHARAGYYPDMFERDGPFFYPK